MKVIFQTKITPEMTVYDSSAPSGIGKTIMNLLDPVFAVQDDSGNTIYQSGEFYESYFPYIAALAIAGVAYMVFRRVK